MAPTDWTQLGLGAVVALLVIREVFAFILKMKKGENGTGEKQLEEIAGQIKHLYKQHTQTDAHGVPIMTSIRLSMAGIEKTQEKQTVILDRITRVLDEMRPHRERTHTQG